MACKLLKNRAHMLPVIPIFLGIAWLFPSPAGAQVPPTPSDRDAHEIVDLANRERVAAGLHPLESDHTLEAAAHEHALRMAAAGSISHQYPGEADLAKRAADAGAQFSLIEENVAEGSTAAQIHDGWMHSQGHHDNLLNPAIDRIGVAVVPVRGVLYVVADYAKLAPSLTLAQVESQVSGVLKRHGLTMIDDPAAARRYCAPDADGLPSSTNTGSANETPRFGMRWQTTDLSVLPQQLEEKIAGRAFHRAAVGACEPHASNSGDRSSFSSFRVAVLLY